MCHFNAIFGVINDNNANLECISQIICHLNVKTDDEQWNFGVCDVMCFVNKTMELMLLIMGNV